MKKTFIIDYTITFNTGTTLNKTMRVHNCNDMLHAKIKFGDYIKRKESEMASFYITNCEDEFNDPFDMLGIDNPFKKK